MSIIPQIYNFSSACLCPAVLGAGHRHQIFRKRKGRKWWCIAPHFRPESSPQHILLSVGGCLVPVSSISATTIPTMIVVVPMMISIGNPSHSPSPLQVHDRGRGHIVSRPRLVIPRRWLLIVIPWRRAVVIIAHAHDTPSKARKEEHPHGDSDHREEPSEHSHPPVPKCTEVFLT